MRIKPHPIIFFIAILFTCLNFGQQTLEEGPNDLEPKKIDLTKIKCSVKPIIHFSSLKTSNLKITFQVGKWMNKDEGPIAKSNNWLAIIDDYDAMQKFFGKTRVERGNKGIYVGKVILISNIKRKINYNSRNGFNLFQTGSESIIIKNSEIESGDLEIIVRFAYVVINNDLRTITSYAKSDETWTVQVPEFSDGQIDCKAKKKEYLTKIAELREKKDNEQAAKTKVDIKKSTELTNCPEIRQSLLSKIDEIIKEVNAENEIAVVEKEKETKEQPVETKTVTQPKASPQKEKELNWRDIENNYYIQINDLKREYKTLQSTWNVIISETDNSIKSNSKEIGFLIKLCNLSEQEKQKRKEHINNGFSQVKETNEVNRNKIDRTILEIRNFISKINKVKGKCQNDLFNLDKDEGKKRYNKFESSFNDLISKIVNEDQKNVSDLQDSEERNNEDINFIWRNKPKEEGQEDNLAAYDKYRAKYDSIYGNIITDIDNIKIEITGLEKDFEDKRYNDWYFKSKKKKFINRANTLYDQLVILNQKDSLYKIEKENLLTEDMPSISPDNERIVDDLLIDVIPELEQLRNNIIDARAKSFPYFYLILLILVISILVFGANVYIKALRAKRKKIKASRPILSSGNNENISDRGGITITQTTNTQSKGKGLFDVRQKAGVDFLELDLNDEWNDTVVKKVYFERDCIIKAYRFFEDSIRETDTGSTANETGGYLIGRWDANQGEPTKFDVSLEDFIEPGDDASFSSHQLNFGAKIGVKLQKTIDNWKQKLNRELVLTAWFHSHPGLKIFLSDFDLSVQNDFSGKEKKQRMLAMVIDPYTPKWDTGIFTYKSDASMNNAKDSRKFFSLDEMYQWAMSRNKNEHEDYFSIELLKYYPGSSIRNAYFSNHCILEIKRKIEDDISRLRVNEVLCLISGNKVNNRLSYSDVLFDELNDNDKEEVFNKSEPNKTFGCIVKTSKENSDISNLLSNSDILNKNIHFVLAYNFEDNSIVPLLRNNKGAFNIIKKPDGLKLTDLINWTRRRN